MQGSDSIVSVIAHINETAKIIEDDHCYQLCLKQEDGTYKSTTYIFKEAFEVLIKLPAPM